MIYPCATGFPVHLVSLCNWSSENKLTWMMITGIKIMMKAQFQTLIDFILPPRCPTCAVRVFEDGHFCAKCWADFSLITEPFCDQCGMPFDYEIDAGSICGSCLDKKPDFDCARSVFRYEGKGRSLVLALKNNRSFVGFSALARLMLLSRSYFAEADIIIPVPLHPVRMLVRRFNQSSLIADAYAVAARGGARVEHSLLKRVKNTPSQGTMSRDKRRKNVRTAFSVDEKAAEKIQGKNILIIDDVYTTGATLNACAKTLKKAGAANVSVLTLARVVGVTAN